MLTAHYQFAMLLKSYKYQVGHKCDELLVAQSPVVQGAVKGAATGGLDGLFEQIGGGKGR